MFNGTRELGFKIEAQNANGELSLYWEGIESHAYFKLERRSSNSNCLGDNIQMLLLNSAERKEPSGNIWKGEDFGYGEHVTQVFPAT